MPNQGVGGWPVKSRHMMVQHELRTSGASAGRIHEQSPRGVSVAAACKIPAPTARQTTRNPCLGPQPLRTHDTQVAKPRLSLPRLTRGVSPQGLRPLILSNISLRRDML